jgi:hypothetical protein
MAASSATTQAPMEGLRLMASSKGAEAASAAAVGTLGFRGEGSAGLVFSGAGLADKDFKLSRFFFSAASCSVLS